MISTNSKFNNPLAKDMTQININNQDNKIEYSIPSNSDKLLKLDFEKYK